MRRGSETLARKATRLKEDPTGGGEEGEGEGSVGRILGGGRTRGADRRGISDNKVGLGLIGWPLWPSDVTEKLESRAYSRTILRRSILVLLCRPSGDSGAGIVRRERRSLPRLPRQIRETVDGERTKRSPFVGGEARAGAVPFVSFPANAPLARNAGYRVVQFFRPGFQFPKGGKLIPNGLF